MGFDKLSLSAIDRLPSMTPGALTRSPLALTPKPLALTLSLSKGELVEGEPSKPAPTPKPLALTLSLSKGELVEG